MIRIVVVGEGVSDPPLTCGLVDRVLCEEVEWLRDQDISQIRAYVGLDGTHEYVQWSQVKTLYREAFPRTGRRFLGKSSGDPDCRVARKLLLLIENAVKRGQQVDGLVIFRDADNQPRRRRGIVAARTRMQANAGTDSWLSHIAIGVAIPENEAWVLAGFEPATDDERERLRSLRARLGFAPNERPERLSANSDPGSLRDAKEALAFLGCDAQRKKACWRDTDLEVLRARGRECGLSDFLDEIRDHLASLFQ